MELKNFAAEDVRVFVARIFEVNGWSERDARITADNLIAADQTGHGSHGIGLLPGYVETMKAGALSSTNRAQTVREDGSFLVIQGNVALGQVAALEATERAIDIARRNGIAVVNLVGAHHVGRIGHYGEMVAAAGFIGLFWANVHGRLPTVVPYGARQPRFSTNPHCVAIPRAGRAPFLLDFATAEFAINKARVAAAQGRRMRPGSLIDADGQSTDDPNVMFHTPRGAITTFGQHKGSGLALACELLSSILGPGPTVADQKVTGAILNNMLAIVIDPARTEPSPGSAAAATDRLLATITSALPAVGFDEVLTPGEPEMRSRAHHDDRLEIEPATWAAIAKAAIAAGVSAEVVPKARGA